jgi:hypothetical protein
MKPDSALTLVIERYGDITTIIEKQGAFPVFRFVVNALIGL